MTNVEKTVAKNYIYKGKILNLRVDDALLANGAPCKREIVEHGGGACVLYEEDGKILFVRQYRYAYGEFVLELPAGKIDKDEEPKCAAARELEEETGIRAARLELLHEIYPSPGYMNERIYLYRAFDGEQVQAHPDEGEFLEVERLSVEEIKVALKAGRIKDAKTLIGIQAYLLEK